MIIFDISQTFHANLHGALKPEKGVPIDENLFRHFVLSHIGGVIRKFRHDYGKEVIIACDSYDNWRKKIFPYYKASRAKNREDSGIDWTSVFKTFDKILAELKESFPYNVIRIVECEADDIIAVLCMNSKDPVVIVSGDKDFRQLQRFKNVKQYDPIKKQMISEAQPERYLRRHIMTGDSVDGIPNFLSDGDTFLTPGKRSKTLGEKKLSLWEDLEPEAFCNETDIVGYHRNAALIDMTKIPQNIQESILTKYKEGKEDIKSRTFNLLPYFIEKKLRNLSSNIDDFI